MTLSIAGRCPETGMLGGAVTSSSICVASRCLFTRAGVGAALTQNVTDPSLGEKMLNLLESEGDVKTALSQVLSEANHIQWRQLVLLDSTGSSALWVNMPLSRGINAQLRQTSWQIKVYQVLWLNLLKIVLVTLQTG